MTFPMIKTTKKKAPAFPRWRAIRGVESDLMGHEVYFEAGVEELR